MTAPLRDRLQTALGGGFTLDRELGGGGMSRVFVARDLTLDRDIVVKVVAPELAEGLSGERFAREIRLAARLQHPHIVPVLSAGITADGLPFYTMPFVDGESLRGRVARGAGMPTSEVVSVLRDVARALSYAHAQGVVHRDIKPENVLVTAGAAVVCDFGVARAVRAAGTGVGTEVGTEVGTGARLTHAGAAIGTPAYMAPEQAAGEPDVDARADLYAWGVLAWELIAGRHPFANRRDAMSLLVAQLTEAPAPLATVVPTVPPALASLVAQCLAKAPEERPTDASALLAVLDAPIEGVAAAPSAAHAATMAIAVLPFTNLSSDPENEYLSDGITDEIIGTLGRVRGVRVLGRASSFALKGTAQDPRALGERLGVGAVLVGSVRRAGNRMRVRVELVDAADGFQRWTEQYDRELEDVLAVEEEIARSIVDALRGSLGALAVATPPAAAPVAPEAYELYLRGRYAWNQRTATASADAVECLTRAVALAPTFARAWSALADAHLSAPVYAGADPAVAWPNARAAAERALALDATLAEAHTSLAYGTMLYEWDWARAERSFQRALAANPAYPTAHHWYADFLAGRGRLEEALAEMERARALDPLSRLTGCELAWTLGLLRRSDDALAQLDAVERLDPNFAHADFVRGLVLTARGEPAAAIPSLRRALELGGFNAHVHAGLVYATAASGDRASATRLLDELQARAAQTHVPPYAFALAYTGLGALDEAFAWLERGIATRDELLAENFCDPLFEPVHRDARCGAIFARLGIERRAF